MFTYDEIENESKAYSNLTNEHLKEADTEALHNYLSLRVSVLEDLRMSKKSYSGACNDLIKKIEEDVRCANREIRHRTTEVREGPERKSAPSHVEVIQPVSGYLPEAGDSDVINGVFE